MKTFDDEFEPGQDNPEDRPKSPAQVFFSWFFALSILATLVYGAYWLHKNSPF
ncbi:MAG: hypothetical protein Q8L64_04355 [bacterium]|nr:hypothetical protein [bacterium]